MREWPRIKPAAWRCLPLIILLVPGWLTSDAFANEAEETKAAVKDSSNWNGRRLMEEVHRRHQQFPYVYEEQSMVMVDRKGQRDTRKARRYSRVEQDGSVRFLLLFESPPEVKGVALLAEREPSGKTERSVYLPALGEQLFESMGDEGGGNFLGTDFSVENLTGEVLSDYQYVRAADMEIGAAPYFVVDVYRRAAALKDANRVRRHHIRQDNFYIVGTDHFDEQGRAYKVQSHHDLKAVDGDMWRAGMILMHDKKEQHHSLIKIERRIFSRDYVPAEIFEPRWLYENYSGRQAEDAEAAIEDEAVELESGEETTALMKAREQK